MPVIENKKKGLRVNLGLPFCLCSHSSGTVDFIWCIVPLGPFSPSLPVHSPTSCTVFLLFVSLCFYFHLSTLGVCPHRLSTCQNISPLCLRAVRRHRPACVYVLGSLTGLDSLWRGAPLTLRVCSPVGILQWVARSASVCYLRSGSPWLKKMGGGAIIGAVMVW